MQKRPNRPTDTLYMIATQRIQHGVAWRRHTWWFLETSRIQLSNSMLGLSFLSMDKIAIPVVPWIFHHLALSSTCCLDTEFGWPGALLDHDQSPQWCSSSQGLTRRHKVVAPGPTNWCPPGYTVSWLDMRFLYLPWTQVIGHCWRCEPTELSSTTTHFRNHKPVAQQQ